VRCYYNDHEPYVAAWLRNLITAGLLPPGDVDERSVTEVTAGDLTGYTQCHFFGGIGGWPYALRLAGWPDDRPVWTASLPCQPFSVAGKAGGVGDERHLWPAFRRLVAVGRPPVCFGEQVASAAGRAWLAGVRADLEGLGYAVGAADLCAASVGAPHIRQRLFWVAESGHAKRWPLNGPGENEQYGRDAGRAEAHRELGACGEVRGLADDSGSGQLRADQLAVHPAHGGREGTRGSVDPLAGSADGGLGDTVQPGLEGLAGNERDGRQPRRIGADPTGPAAETSHAADGYWTNAIWLPCRDGKARRLEPGLEPLVDGIPFRLVGGGTVEGASRTGILRGLGNAIVPQLAAEFVRAYLETA
jgi:DNA (cytosine-5)-methyltransferase 1